MHEHKCVISAWLYDLLIWTFSTLYPVKTSPSKKRRAVAPSALKKANMAGSGPALFALSSSNSQQPAVQQDVAESKADTEEDGGKIWKKERGRF